MIKTIRAFFFPTVDSITASVSKQVDRLQSLAERQKAKHDEQLSRAAALITEANQGIEARKRTLRVADKLARLVD